MYNHKLPSVPEAALTI